MSFIVLQCRRYIYTLIWMCVVIVTDGDTTDCDRDGDVTDGDRTDCDRDGDATDGDTTDCDRDGDATDGDRMYNVLFNEIE